MAGEPIGPRDQRLPWAEVGMLLAMIVLPIVGAAAIAGLLQLALDAVEVGREVQPEFFSTMAQVLPIIAVAVVIEWATLTASGLDAYASVREQVLTEAEDGAGADVEGWLRRFEAVAPAARLSILYQLAAGEAVALFAVATDSGARYTALFLGTLLFWQAAWLMALSSAHLLPRLFVDQES